MKAVNGRAEAPPLPALGVQGLSFLHFGAALDGLQALLRLFGTTGRVWNAEVRRALTDLPGTDECRRAEVLDAVDFVTGPGHSKLPLDDLAHGVAQSLAWRKVFQTLRCRGFSFRLCEEPTFRSCVFARDVNLRFALLAEPSLYYPPGVRQGLRKVAWRNRHVPHAIGWMLGMEKCWDGCKWWYVVNVQSDLMSSPESGVKEIFRGWQRVLFRLVAELARCRGVAMLALPSVEVLAQTRDDRVDRASRRQAWHPLYDGLADFFHMRGTPNPYPTDTQPLLFSEAAWSSRFYVSSVVDLTRPSLSGDARPDGLPRETR